MSLANLKTSLGCVSEEKGGFPMSLNHNDLIDIVMSHYPNLDCFPIQKMSEKQKTSFLEWWMERKNEPFHLLQQLVDYCVVRY